MPRTRRRPIRWLRCRSRQPSSRLASASGGNPTSPAPRICAGGYGACSLPKARSPAAFSFSPSCAKSRGRLTVRSLKRHCCSIAKSPPLWVQMIPPRSANGFASARPRICAWLWRTTFPAYSRPTAMCAARRTAASAHFLLGPLRNEPATHCSTSSSCAAAWKICTPFLSIPPARTSR